MFQNSFGCGEIDSSNKTHSPAEPASVFSRLDSILLLVPYGSHEGQRVKVIKRGVDVAQCFPTVTRQLCISF